MRVKETDLSAPTSRKGNELSDRIQTFQRFQSPNADVMPIVFEMMEPEKAERTINLGIAESALMQDVLTKRYEEKFKLNKHDFGYQLPWGRQDLREALASNLFNEHFKPVKPVNADEMILGLGLFSCLDALSFATTNPGDGILIQAPYYHSLDLELTARNGSIMLPVEVDTNYKFDDIRQIKEYEKTLKTAKKEGGITTKAVALINPSNPLGTCYSRAFLIELLKFAAKYDLHIYSDEIYALSTWEEPNMTPFISLLNIDAMKEAGVDPSVFILYSMSKDFGSNGFRMATILSQNNKIVMDALRTISMYTMVPSPTQVCFMTIFSDAEFTRYFVNENRKRLGNAYAAVTKKFTQCGIPYDPSNSAQFVWIDLAKWIPYAKKMLEKGDDAAKDVESLSIKYGSRTHMDKAELYITRKFFDNDVFLLAGSASQAPTVGKFRLTFTMPTDKVIEGIDRMVKTLKQLEKDAASNA